MSAQCEVTAKRATGDVMGAFERYLSLWVALALVSGIALGKFFPATFEWLSSLEIASVNLVVAVLIWAMVYPMMINVDFSSLKHAGDKPKGLTITLVINWLVKPFTMAGLAVLFFNGVFAGLVPPDDAKAYIAGMILLGAAPCTAMVFVWSQLTEGDVLFAFAPLVAFLLGVAEVIVPWQTLLLSVGLYVLIPLIAGALTREYLTRRGGQANVDQFTARIKPITVIGLVATGLLLFAFQGERILNQPLVIGLIAIPLIIQSVGIFAIAYLWARAWSVPVSIGAPAALIGTSNFFELAVAVAISLFGLNSGAALATVVGVLVEVPIMLALVKCVNGSRRWYDRLNPATPSGSA
jgi:ACR3 family arsenite transporter